MRTDGGIHDCDFVKGECMRWTDEKGNANIMGGERLFLFRKRFTFLKTYANKNNIGIKL